MRKGAGQGPPRPAPFRISGQQPRSGVGQVRGWQQRARLKGWDHPVSSGLLLVMHDVARGRESEFCRWWDSEYMPAMLGVPGITACWFYQAVEGRPVYLQIYDLASLDVIQHPGYFRARGWGPHHADAPRGMFAACSRLTVGVYKQLLALPSASPDLSRVGAALLAGLEIGREHEEEFEDWYNTEHLPNLSGATGVLRARRFRLDPRARDKLGEPVTYLALYEAESTDSFAREEWVRLGQTPWTRRLKRYFSLPIRNIYKRIIPTG